MSQLAMITFLSGPGGGPVDPGYGVGGGGNYPTTGPLPGGGRPDNSLPGGGQAIQLPVFPFDPTTPDNTLPDVPTVWPPRPGGRFIVKWLACYGLILVPDNGLPQTPEPK